MASMPVCAAAHALLCVIRRFQRGLKRKPLALIKKLRKAKREAASGEKPEPVRTHLRNMIIVPEMIGSIIGVYNGKTFNQVSSATSHMLWFEPTDHPQEALQTFLSSCVAIRDFCNCMLSDWNCSSLPCCSIAFMWVSGQGQMHSCMLAGGDQA